MEWASGNIYIRPNKLEKVGDDREGHTHNFDHTTIFLKGSFHVEATLPNGERIDRDFTAPSHCLIRADVKHKITALEAESEFWCVYSHRNAQGEIVQEWNGWESNYV